MRKSDKFFDPFAERPVDGVIAAQVAVSVGTSARVAAQVAVSVGTSARVEVLKAEVG